MPSLLSAVDELRALARLIEQATLDAPCASVALPVVRPCVDHLLCMARLHELRSMTLPTPPNPPGYGN